MNEALIKKCLEIYKKRETAYYSDAQKFNELGRSDQYDYCLSAAMAYNSAATMLMYALDNDDEGLSQYNY